MCKINKKSFISFFPNLFCSDTIKYEKKNSNELLQYFQNNYFNKINLNPEQNGSYDSLDACMILIGIFNLTVFQNKLNISI